MTDDMEIIHSPLAQTYSADGHTLRVDIYRSAAECQWILEVEDEQGNSTVWDDPFETDKAALEAAILTIEEKGIASFVMQGQQAAKAAEPELLRKLEALKPPSQFDPKYNMMMGPLSEKELEELGQFLLYLDNDESMTLDMLDGFLHAIAIGPETVMPSQWLPMVWGEQDSGGMMPPVDTLDQVTHLLGLVMRHFNSIVFGFGQDPKFVELLWSTTEYDGQGEFEDAEMWAYGFCQGIKLTPAAWQPLLKDARGADWFRPIGLLGQENFSPDQDELTRTPEQRHALAKQIEDSVRQIHAFWLPLRQAVAERQQARRLSTKVGRNEPCPCGSGKKFKKCCGAPSELH
jgi:uncharacterized protein